MAARARSTKRVPAGVVVIEGMSWRPRPEATSTVEEFTAARTRFQDIHAVAEWSPWERDDHAAELDAAMAVMGQWTRAEPNFTQRPTEEVMAELHQWLAELPERSRLEAQAQRRTFDGRRESYDKARHDARLEMLEVASILAQRIDDRTRLATKTAFPAMDDTRRAAQIAELDVEIDARQRRLGELRERVGDPEAVVDETGRLPADRRELSLFEFRWWRESRVRSLRADLDDLRGQVAAASGRGDRARIRAALDRTTREHDELCAMPPMTPADMCGDCIRPLIWHGWVAGGPNGSWCAAPCPAWPGWAARLDHVRGMLRFFADEKNQSTAAPAQPVPQPIATIKNDLPIEEVISQLAAFQTEHPAAHVRRGKRGRWEIWPAAEAQRA